jgi:hypothetical protein
VVCECVCVCVRGGGGAGGVDGNSRAGGSWSQAVGRRWGLHAIRWRGVCWTASQLVKCFQGSTASRRDVLLLLCALASCRESESLVSVVVGVHCVVSMHWQAVACFASSARFCPGWRRMQPFTCARTS